MPAEIDPKYLDIIIELFNRKGIFSFSTQGKYKYKVPYFCVKSKIEEIYFLKLLRREFKIKSKIYTYEGGIGKDGYIRSGFSILIIRSIGELKDAIIPFASKYMTATGRVRFLEWISKIKETESVPSGYRQLPAIAKLK